MKNKKLLWIIFLVLFSEVFLFADINKKVLIINSYHRGFQWSDDVITGIEDVLYDTKVDTTFLYMDSKRISSPQYYKELRDLYKIQLKNQKYDLVLAIDKFSYDFSVENYAELFTNEELFFVGIEQFFVEDVKEYNLENKVSGLLEKRSIQTNIENIYKLMPNLKKLYIINDKSANGDDTEPFVHKAIDKIGNKFEIQYIRQSTLKDLKKKFSIKKKNEAVFFIRFYNDKDGNFYKNSEIASMIDASELPVFVTDTLFVGNGAFGGKLVTIKELGKNTGEKVLSILNGELKTPYIQSDENYKYIFDYAKAKKFALNPKSLGKSFSYINEPVSFFDKYQEFINFVFIISPFLIFLIFGLIHNLYLRIKSAKLLKERMEFDKILLDAIQSPIVWQDKGGRIVDSNAKFCDLMGLPCPDTKGKTLQEYIEKRNANSLIKALSGFITNTKERNEITLKDNNDQDYIYLINQTNYSENIYKSSGTVTIFTDITKEKAALLEKMKHQEFIIQQSKLAEIGEIFSSIAHQWKSPLVEIATLAQEQLYSSEGEIDEKNSFYVNETMTQVRYMTETINDFQDFIMPSNQKTVFDINEAVVKMMDIIRHNMKYNYIDVNIIVKPNTNLMVSGYRNELMQTLLNIVNNAKDAIVKEKILKKVDRGLIDITISNVENFLQIEIQDNGGGIPSEHMHNIFEAYFTTKKGGHGIGLYMAKLIIENKMGGTISCHNTKKGVTFLIRLELDNENISS
ncbi:MAG: signal transduction histidine kinase [Sulfurimonas sp.]|jgi:signal transduction histidine kinase